MYVPTMVRKIKNKNIFPGHTVEYRARTLTTWSFISWFDSFSQWQSALNDTVGLQLRYLTHNSCDISDECTLFLIRLLPDRYNIGTTLIQYGNSLLSGRKVIKSTIRRKLQRFLLFVAECHRYLRNAFDRSSRNTCIRNRNQSEGRSKNSSRDQGCVH